MITGIKTCISQYNNLKMNILNLLVIYTAIKIYKRNLMSNSTEVSLSVMILNTQFY